MRMIVVRSLLLVIVALILGKVCQSQPVENTTVEQILRANDKQNRMTHADEVKQFGTEVMDELARLLTDQQIGYQASDLMIEIDPVKAGALIFPSMPKSDRNVQYYTFRFYIRRLLVGEKVTYQSAMHDAAVRCLKAETNADAAEQALLAIGLTGSKADYALLEAFFKNTHETPVWRLKLRDAAEAALARLGHEKYLKLLMDELKQPVSKNAKIEEARQYLNTAQSAAYVGNVKLIPALASHLHENFTLIYGCQIFGRPAQTAAMAMDCIINHQPFESSRATVEQWQQWWAKHAKEYQQ